MLGRLYLVGDERAVDRALAPALAGGVDLFQLRMKGAADDAVLRVAERARALCAAAGVPFLVNDRPDLAARAGADGVHVGQDDAPVAAARAVVGPGAVVGRSTHAPEQLAASADADYVAVGPVHATPTKPGRPAAGAAYVAHAAAHAPPGLPWFAIGGIDAATLPAVLEAGARRVVVVRAIADADDPEAAARHLKEALDGAA
jgi:thiamine-phosphate pyrophosphorylase